MSGLKKQKSLKLNFIMNAILTISSFIFPLITFPYVSRVLLPVGTGKVAFATSLISYFALFAQLGIPTYGIRACAKVRDDRLELTRTVHELFIINLIMSVVAYGVLAVALIAVPRLHEDRLLYVIVSSTMLFNCIGMEWMYKALEQYTYITVRSIAFKLVALVAMFLLIHEQSDYIIYGGVSVLAASASNIFNFCHAHRYIRMRPVGGYRLRRHLRPVAVFFFMSCATTIYTHLDTLMLGFMTSDVDVGYYNAAVKIKSVLLGVVTSLGTVLLPRVSYYVEMKRMEDFWHVTRKAVNFVFLLAAPLVMYFILYAKQGINFLSGVNYANSVSPMQVIMPTLLFIGLSNILGIQILVPLGKEKIVLVSEVAGALVDLVLNYLLIPRLASTGAAIGTLVAEFVVLSVQYYALRADISKVFRAINYRRILLALLAAGLCSFWVKMIHMDNFLSLVVSSMLFFGAYLGVMMIMKEELVLEIFGQVMKVLHIGKTNA